MGNVKSIGEYFSSPVQPKKSIIIGLDACGKTEILYKLKGIRRPSRTIGFNVEQIEYKGSVFCIWDLPGNDKERKTWGHFTEGVDYIIFVVDSYNPERMEETKNVLFSFLQLKDSDIPLLIYANKQDFEAALTIDDIVEQLELYSIPSTRPWRIQPSCAITNEGLFEGLDWFLDGCPFNSERFKKVKSAKSAQY